MPEWHNNRHDSARRIGPFVLVAYDGGFWRVLWHPNPEVSTTGWALWKQGTVGREGEKPAVLLAKAKRAAEDALLQLGRQMGEELNDG